MERSMPRTSKPRSASGAALRAAPQPMSSTRRASRPTRSAWANRIRVALGGEAEKPATVSGRLQGESDRGSKGSNVARVPPYTPLMPRTTHPEIHRTSRVGWLRAAVLGANDGIVSTASLLVGVAAASVSTDELLTIGLAGLVAGAMSMAAGEYVSVSSQADTEAADLAREREELLTEPESEHLELAMIYQSRGLTPELASQVAHQLTEHDALGAHARDELGISEISTARPVQAALTSAATFALGAALPLIAALLAPAAKVSIVVAATSIMFLGGLGAIAAHAGGAPVGRGAFRVVFWGALAMAVTAFVGKVFGAAV
jgi:vacuolar iron transporter family protein